MTYASEKRSRHQYRAFSPRTLGDDARRQEALITALAENIHRQYRVTQNCYITKISESENNLYRSIITISLIAKSI